MRWTKAEYDKYKRNWLLERMSHKWSEGAGCKCTLCGAKYTAHNTRRFCPKRKRPNRWRVHFSRAVLHAQYGQSWSEAHVTRDAGWILGQLAEIRRAVNRDPRFEDQRYWKYHRLARRYRRLMREWWQLPVVPPQCGSDSNVDRFGASITAKRNRLLKQVIQTQARVIRDGPCTYTFYADAKWNGLPLFAEEG